MASPSSSSSSSKQNLPVWKPPGKLNTKMFPTVDDYIGSYLAANLLRPQLPQLNKSPSVFCQPASDGEARSRNKSENHRRSKTRNKTEAEKINELAKEMDKMLSRAKSKRQTNDLLQLFKNTLSNFIVPEHPMDDKYGACGKNDLKLKRKKQISLPTSPTNYQYNSQDINEINSSDQNLLSDQETSMTVTTTMTQYKVKEPVVNVMQSSKTNVLHRCYGKQSVKALPQTYKSRKKYNNNVPNCQRPPVLKAKSSKSSKLPQVKTNQQMKTIYENEKFDISKKLITENFDDIDYIMIDNSTSTSSVDTDRQSVAEVYKNNEVIDNSNKKSEQDCAVPKIMNNKKSEMKSEKSNQEIKKQPSICMNSYQENSIVQRLTSFWNKKLNTLGQTNSATDQSSTSSSLTSISEENAGKIVNENESCKTSTTEIIKFEEENLNEDNKMDESQNCNEGDKNICNKNDLINNNNYETANVVKKIHFSQNSSDLPDMKIGLMNELIKVLQNRENKIVNPKKRDYEEKAVKENINYTNESNSKINCLIGSDSQNSVEINDTGDESSNYAEDDYNDADSDDGNDLELCDEQTLEAIENCLLESVTHKIVYEDDNSCSKVQDEKCVLDSSNISKNENNYDSNNNKIKNGEEIKYNENDKFLFTIRNDYENDVKDYYDLSEPDVVITNVNSIIANLKKLICTIESIPEELKSVNMSLNSLPIPDKIKRKISTLIVTPDNESNTDNESSVVQSISNVDNQFEMLVMPDEHNQLFQCSSSGKLKGYLKREGHIYLLYFPKILTLPIVQNVKNPIQQILFPRQSEYLNALRNKSYSNKKRHDMGISIRETVDKGFPSITNIQEKSAENTNHEKEEKTINEGYNVNNENSQSDSDTISKNVIEIDDTQSVELSKLKTTASLFYVTASSNPTVSALSVNKTSHDFYPESRKAISIKPYKTTTVFTQENLPFDLNIKSNIKFEEHVLVKNNNISPDNSFEELSDRTSGGSCTLSNTNQQEDFNLFSISNINNTTEGNDCFRVETDAFRKESILNLDENRSILSGDFITVNRRFNNNIRRRRYHMQNHIDNDATPLAGGSGDSMHNCGDTITSPAIPCHHTSSMSVVVSNSVYDSNSQPDINVDESELNLSRLRSYGHCSSIPRSLPPQDGDNFSTCGVIQEERSDEQLSDIDDCVMVEQHSNKKDNNNNNNFDMISATSILSHNVNSAINHEQVVAAVISKDCKGEYESNEKQRKNEKQCDLQFSFQNITNKINEETLSFLSQNSSNDHEEEVTSQDNYEDISKSKKKRVSQNYYEKEFSYKNDDKNIMLAEKIVEDDGEVIVQPDIKLQVTPFVSENIHLRNNFSIRSLSQLNLSIDNNNCNDASYTKNSDGNVCFLNGSDKQDHEKESNKRSDNFNKNDFHRSYHILYFETEISEEAKSAIKNKIIANNYNDLETELKKDQFLKSELSKVIDIDNLSSEEKQLIAVCIHVVKQNYFTKQPSLFNTSPNNLILKSNFDLLWDKTSRKMSTTIQLAKKSLIPYDFETEQLLYQRCRRKLVKAFYTLFISLLLIFVIQKKFFGILLPVCFPW